MSFRLVNSLILEHLRWFGYQLEARILERELNVKAPNQQRPDSKLMSLLSKCIERSDDPQLYLAFEDQRNGLSSKGHLSSNQSIGMDNNRPHQRPANRKLPSKSVGQSNPRRTNYHTDRVEDDVGYYSSNGDQGFSHGNGSNIAHIANALRNKRNSVALTLHQQTPRSSQLPHHLQSESSPHRNHNNSNFDTFTGPNGSSGDEGGFFQPGPNGFGDLGHLESNQRYYSFKQGNNGVYQMQPRKPEKLRSKQVSSSYQTPQRALPYNTQSLNNSYLASLEPSHENGYAIENPYTNAKVPSRDNNAIKARPVVSEGWNSSMGYTRNNPSPSGVRSPERISLSNYNNDTILPPASYPKSQSNNKSKLLHLSANMGNNKAGPSWRNNQAAAKLGFTKEPSPFTRAGDQISGDNGRPNDKRGVGGSGAKASKGPEPQVMDYLMSNTSFSDNELRAFYEAFVRINGNLELQPMDKQKFKEFASYARNIHGDHFAECLFYFGPQLSLMDGSKGTIEFKEAVSVLDKVNHDNPFNLMHFIFRLSTGEEYKEANLLLVETLLKEVKAANNNGRVLILLESLDFVIKDGRVGRSDFLSFEEYLEIVRGFEPMRKYC